MQLWLPEEIVAVLAYAVEPREDALVVDSFALDIEEGPLAHVVDLEDGRLGRASGRCAQQQGARRQQPHRATHRAYAA